MLVVSDTDDIFLPKPTDLLLNLSECKAGLEALLGRINEMFQENHTVGTALGPAMQAGFKLMVRRLGLTSEKALTLHRSAVSDWRKDCRPIR
jgi:hypothetical protein